MSLRALSDRINDVVRGSLPRSGRRPDKRYEYAARTLRNLQDCFKYGDLAEQARELLTRLDRHATLDQVAAEVTRRVMKTIEGKIAVAFRSGEERSHYVSFGGKGEEWVTEVRDWLMEVLRDDLIAAFKAMKGGRT